MQVIYSRRITIKFDIYKIEKYFYFIIYILTISIFLNKIFNVDTLSSVLISFSSLIFQEINLNLNKNQKSYLTNLPFYFAIPISLIGIIYYKINLFNTLIIIILIQIIHFFITYKNVNIGNESLFKIYNKQSLYFFIINIIYVCYSEFASLGFDFMQRDEYFKMNTFSRFNAVIYSVYLIIPNIVWNDKYDTLSKVDSFFLNVRKLFKYSFNIYYNIFS